MQPVGTCKLLGCAAQSMVEFTENSDSIGKVVGRAGVLAPVEGVGAMLDRIGVGCTMAMSWAGAMSDGVDVGCIISMAWAGATSGGVDVECVMSMSWAITGSRFLVGASKPASSLVGIEPMCRSAG